MPGLTLCPTCKRPLKRLGTWHNCVSTTLDDLLAGRPDELVLLVDSLLTIVKSWEGVVVSTTQNCIVFVHRQTFMILRPLKNELDIKFYLSSEPEISVHKVLATGKRFEVHLRLAHEHQLSPAVVAMLRSSYELL